VNLTERLRAFTADSMVRAIVGSRSEHRDACQKRTHTGMARNAGDLLRRALNGTEGEEHSHTRTQRRNTGKGIFCCAKELQLFCCLSPFIMQVQKTGEPRPCRTSRNDVSIPTPDSCAMAGSPGAGPSYSHATPSTRTANHSPELVRMLNY
jgi:hypothetical protein